MDKVVNIYLHKNILQLIIQNAVLSENFLREVYKMLHIRKTKHKFKLFKLKICPFMQRKIM